MFAWRDNYMSYNAGAGPTDPYWSSVSLLTNYEIPSTAFTDGSTNNFDITVGAGNPRPNLRTPFTGTGASMYFSGAANTFLSAPANVGYAFGTGDFTVELWYYRTVTSSAAALVGAWTGTSATSAWLLTQGQSNTANIRFGASDGSTSGFVESSACIVNNTWGHIAVSRGSSVLKMFYNGTQVYSAANTTNISNSSTSLQIMAVISSFLSTGFISNLRIVKGTAVYTAAFTPPTSPLTAISGTSFLLTCTNQGAQSSSFAAIDSSINSASLTRANNPSYSGLSPFFTAAPNLVPGSISLNGTSQYIQNNGGTGVPTGTGAYTVEGWVRFNAIVALVGQTWIEANRAANGGFFIGLGISNGGSNNGFRIGKSYLADCEYCNFTFSLNTWYHIAQVRSGTTIYFFVNGVQQTTQAGGGGSTGSYSWPTPTTSRWGAGGNTTSFLNYMNGNLSNWRVVNGTALYTSNFTPSTTPLTAITNTVMLMSHQQSPAMDLSNNGNPIYSTADINTTVVKFGTQSGKGGGGDIVSNATNLQLTGDFTIECWIYPIAGGALAFMGKGSASTGWQIGKDTSNLLTFTSGLSVTMTSTTSIPTSAWTYIAFTRSGSTIYMFINGNLETSVIDTTSFNQTQSLYVNSGRLAVLSGNGYIDDVRITKGVARYTATFTAPTSAFPTS